MKSLAGGRHPPQTIPLPFLVDSSSRITSQMVEGAAPVGVFYFILGSVNNPWNVAGSPNASNERGFTRIPRGIFNTVTPTIRRAQKMDRARAHPYRLNVQISARRSFPSQS